MPGKEYLVQCKAQWTAISLLVVKITPQNSPKPFKERKRAYRTFQTWKYGTIQIWNSVDEDIDPLNLQEVVWAMATRVDPQRSVHIIPYCRTGSPDPRVPLAEKKKYKTTPKPLMASRIVVNACRPFEHKSEWYPVSRMSPQLREKTFEKWESLLKELI